MNERMRRLSKLLSLVLRHRPELVGIRLDEFGFSNVDVDELARRISRLRGFEWVTAGDIERVVMRDPRGRFEIRGGRIRATYGHSVPVLPPGDPLENPPPVLYHGTTRRALGRILREGIRPMRRRFVHLSATPEVAAEVGRRHGRDVVVLVVDARGLVQRGIGVWRVSDLIYLTEWVPPKLIRGLSEEGGLAE
ncbi:MAG: RNA 2'-phosphotransferase [Thermoproteota archaeon]|nr:MAG: RNA 2'-phosphotransferase [Candidatus Korarchaeota archaeon]